MIPTILQRAHFSSAVFIPVFENLETGTLIFVERFAWWFHIVGILGFALYVTHQTPAYFMAFPNTYYAKLEPKGHINNMPVVTNEVKSMLGIAEAGATLQQNPVDSEQRC